MPTDDRSSIHTGGGAAANDVNTQGGDFVGRDKIAYSINFFGPIEIKEKAAQSSWQNFDWSKAEQIYRETLIRHYGNLRVIGATVDSPLDNIFTDVFILNQLTAHRRATIEELKNVDPDSFRQTSSKHERISGLKLIQEGMKGKYPTHFYILGKPGAGKTTFLKYITIQAARHQTIDHIPIFISLHEWARSKNEDLFAFIVSRFAVSHVPDAAPFVKLLLEEGKALLLFDGLDEVRHERKKRDRLTSQLQDFVRQYDRCPQLITCRIAASEYIFQGFRTVEVADFTPEQIDSYAAKWFGSERTTYEFFMQELRKPEQKGVYELCNTPLLLSLICLAFANDRAFPPTRAELYEDALDVLLRRWDASRQIDRDALHPDEKIYRQLSTQRKKELFARIAQRTFQRGEYFFRRRDLEAWINEYLETLPNIKTIIDVDGQIILKAIEAQHGILIERAKDIYSFSHLTFHEFFTAQYIKQNQSNGVVASMIADHVGNSRWHEVLLLTSSLLSGESANYFFLEVQQRLDQLIITEPPLLFILSWVERKSRLTGVLVENQDMVRLVYIFLAIIRARAFARARDRSRELDLIRVRALDRALDLILNYALARSFTRALVLNLDLARTLALDLALDVAVDLSRANFLMLELSRLLTPLIGFDYGIFYAYSYAQLFANESLDQNDRLLNDAMATYPHLINGLSGIAKEARLIGASDITTIQNIPSLSASQHNWQVYANAISAILQKRDLDQEVDINLEQIEKLNRYFVGNELIAQCLKVTTVTDRLAILRGLLEPPVIVDDVQSDKQEKEKMHVKPWWKVW